MNVRDREQIRETIERRMASFEAAERTLDVPGLLAHFSDAGDFYMHNDGQRLSLETITAGVSQVFPTLRSMDGGFRDIDIHVLATDAALVTALFRETITSKDRSTVRQRGAASWLWKLRAGSWKIVYGHVDHYPDAES